jgi:NAD(P)-dependent dehydrogenase (short-subunit alcohol dehydrogenase family)
MGVSDLFSIEGKTAVVTGGGRGVGAMIAAGYLEAGAARVYLVSRKASELEATAQRLGGFTGEAVPLAADLSEHDECKRVAQEVSDAEHGRLDILVNNAGANWGAPYAEFPDSAWDRVLDVNVKGVFHLTRYLTPALRAAATRGNPSRVINIGSIDGIRVPELETYSYSASKAAVHHLTRVLARRLASENITVNAIAPGPFESKMMAATLELFRDAIEDACPLGRIGEPDDIAAAAIYLAARASAWVTGVILPVDGGMATTV